MIVSRVVIPVFWLLLVADGVAAEALEMPPMHHLVKVTPSKAILLPDSFPLNQQGQIDCTTCHGLKDIEKTALKEVDRAAENFFREGPYPRLITFCQRCHDDTRYARPNIHQLLDEAGNYEKQACEYCHLEAPDPEQSAEQQTIKLRLPPEVLCLGCHLKTPHLNALNHQVEPDEAMVKRIKQSERELSIILPLDQKGRVMCVTCHSPHQSGLIDRSTPAGRQVADTGLDEGVTYQAHSWNSVFIEDKAQRLKALSQQSGHTNNLEYQRIKTEVLLRLPAKDGALCLACHAFED